MSKWYEVTVTTVMKVVVEVDDIDGEADAYQYALEEVEGPGKNTLAIRPLADNQIFHARRHAHRESLMEDI